MPPVAQRHVLVVDDEGDILASMRDVLECFLHDVKVTTVASGEEALKVLAHERVDLLLTDYRMPGMDGLDLVRRARDVAPAATRLMFTAYPDRNLLRHAQDAGCTGVLVKPFETNQIVGWVEAALEGHAGPPPPPSPMLFVSGASPMPLPAAREPPDASGLAWGPFGA